MHLKLSNNDIFFSRPLTKQYQQVAKSVYSSIIETSGVNRRKRYEDSMEKFSTLLDHIIMFEKGAKLFPGNFMIQKIK